jgi:MFS family permease
MNRNLYLLAVCQGLFLTNNVVFIAINGLIGLSMAPLGWMATLPVMGYVVGGALSTPLVARSQQAWGRKGSFQIGLAVGLFSALLCAWAVAQHQFWLLVAGTVVAGYYSANGQLYRFAAAELAAPAYREKAISLVMAGGLIGAVIGPNLATRTKNLMAVPFAGAYVSLAIVAVICMLIMSRLQFPPVPAKVAGSPAGRPLSVIMRQPVFIVSTVGAALGYGVMNLLMAATPLAMQICNLPFEDAANAGCIAVALSGVELHQFLVALFLLGVGWNFLFTGSTTLSLQAYRPEEKDRAQAAINFCVFAVMAMTSFASGALVTTQGWRFLNIGSIVPVVLTAAALAWLALHLHRRQPAPV